MSERSHRMAREWQGWRQARGVSFDPSQYFLRAYADAARQPSSRKQKASIRKPKRNTTATQPGIPGCWYRVPCWPALPLWRLIDPLPESVLTRSGLAPEPSEHLVLLCDLRRIRGTNIALPISPENQERGG